VVEQPIRNRQVASSTLALGSTILNVYAGIRAWGVLLGELAPPRIHIEFPLISSRAINSPLLFCKFSMAASMSLGLTMA
jgi:hypothetical protein